MVATKIEESLSGMECPVCKGVWISPNSYWQWLKDKGSVLPEKPQEYTLRVELSDSKNIKVCPECSHFMTRRKVGHGIPFCVERCETCGGIWLDRNEWNVLKSRNLHDEIHFIFSEPWQKTVTREEQRKSNEVLAKKILGETDFKKILDVQKWLSNHPHKNFVMAYLNNF
jgi:Zn-finger nucleic acid-binding protein